jgi:ABC-type transporter Mla MlaB component
VTVLVLPARLTLDTAALVYTQGLAILRTKQHLELDASGLIEVDTSILALWLDWLGEAQRHKKQVVMSPIPETVLHLAQAFGVSELLSLASTR